MRSRSTQALAEAGMMIALAVLLSNFKIFRMPQGGSVTAGSMIPILIVALRWGPRTGLLTGAAYGAIRYMMGGYVIHPIQGLLDYPIAFGLLGLAGLFRRQPVAGVGAGLLGRFAAHLTAGAVFFGEYAPAGQSPWVYSAIYNSGYLGAELVISAVIVWLLAQSGALRAALPGGGPT
ncbi:MAG: energy-coupled thiamine transporter ThiT [Bacillota bacterium]|nr:energy-coupled thiamine transporter ThiT [Bacillota bacterium]